LGKRGLVAARSQPCNDYRPDLALYRTNELPFHLNRALENGLTRDEIIATITHLAFYAGWPPAMTALQIARKVFEDVKP
jgi:4-carboxymuconolactone decarboxylase